jgi:hypothetical protein
MNVTNSIIGYLIAVLILINFSNIFAQDSPSNYAVEAYNLQKTGRVRESIVMWKKDFQVNTNPEAPIEIAALFTILQKPDSAFVWLYKASSTDSTLFLFQDERFFPLLTHKEWTEFETQQVKKVESKSGKIKNLNLAKKIWYLGMKDQAYSYEGNLANKILGDTSPITTAVWQLQIKNRQENLVDIEGLINKHGWPRASSVGKLASKATFYIVQHAENKNARKKYLHKLKQACEEHEADWHDYAMMFDRLSLEENGSQLYGTQYKYGNSHKLELLPIQSPEYVDKRRKALGMPPLGPQVEQIGIVFDVLQKN